MLVFFKERLAFLSVPKTGTTAYQTALAPRADMVINDPPLLKHAPVYRYNRFIRQMFLDVCEAEMELMTVMREPVRWLSSWYRHARDALPGMGIASPQSVSTCTPAAGHACARACFSSL